MRGANRCESRDPSSAVMKQRHRHRQHPQAGLERVEALDDLQVQRDREEDPHEDEVLEAEHREARAQRRHVKQAQVDQRLALLRLAPALPAEEDGEHADARGDQERGEREAEGLDRRVARLEPAPGARVEHAEHDRGQARRGQQRAHRVELGTRAAAVVGQPAQAEQDADHHDDLAREHDAPRQVGRHPAAQDRPDRDAGARHAAEHPVGERALLALEAAGGQRRQRGQHERGTDPLQHRPAQRQHRHAPRHRGEQRAGAVDHVADPERAPAPHDVAELAAGDHERGHHERVEGDDRLDAGHVGVEVLDQLRDGHVHHRLVEDHQELRGREDR